MVFVDWPIAAGFASAFYVTLAAMAFSPAFRDWMCAHLRMPGKPTSGTISAPLDALRGIAALWVASFHSWQWWNIATGSHLYSPRIVTLGVNAVPLFVGLSGFLIYRSLQRVKTLDGLQRYAQNRALRILPVYVITTIAAFALLKSPSLGRLVAELFALRTLGYPDFANPPAWSLYVEIMFYLIAPMFVLCARRYAWIAALVGFIVFSLADPAAAREFQLAKYFLVGILASEAHDRVVGRIPESAALLLFGAGLYGMAGGLPSHLPAYSVPLGIMIFVLLLGATLSARLARFFDLAPWHMLAGISFSLYLWHSFIVIADSPIRFEAIPMNIAIAPPDLLVRLFVVLPGALFVAGVSFLLIERPFLCLRSAPKIRSASSVGGGISEPATS